MYLTPRPGHVSPPPPTHTHLCAGSPPTASHPCLRGHSPGHYSRAAAHDVAALFRIARTLGYVSTSPAAAYLFMDGSPPPWYGARRVLHERVAGGSSAPSCEEHDKFRSTHCTAPFMDPARIIGMQHETSCSSKQKYSVGVLS